MFNNENTEVCIADLETLAHHSDAQVLSAGFVVAPLKELKTFSELVDNHSLFLKFDIKEQGVKYHRAFDESIMKEFWLDDTKTSKEAREISLYPKSTDVSIDRLSNELFKFFVEQKIKFKTVDIGDRNAYDLSKMSHIFGQTNTIQPWSYRNGFEIVSVLKAWGADRYAGIDPKDIPRMVYHHPVHDSALDWLRMQYQAIEVGAIEKPDGYSLEHILQ